MQIQLYTEYDEWFMISGYVNKIWFDLIMFYDPFCILYPSSNVQGLFVLEESLFFYTGIS